MSVSAAVKTYNGADVDRVDEPRVSDDSFIASVVLVYLGQHAGQVSFSSITVLLRPAIRCVCQHMSVFHSNGDGTTCKFVVEMVLRSGEEEQRQLS